MALKAAEKALLTQFAVVPLISAYTADMQIVGYSNSPTTAPMTLNKVGNTVVLGLKVWIGADTPTITSPGINDWVQIGPTGSESDLVQIWSGTVIATGSQNITVTSSTGNNVGWAALEIYATAGTLTVDTQGTNGQNGSNQTISFPSLTPAGANEAYFGMAESAYRGVQPPTTPTPGYTYVWSGDSGLDSASCFIYNLNCSTSTQAPTAQESSAGGGTWATTAVLIKA